MYCPKCGNQIRDDSKFCEACGNSFTRNATQSVNFSNSNQLISGYSTGTSAAGLVMAIFNVIFAVFMRFNVYSWLDEDEFMAFLIPTVILIAIFSILLAVNHKKKDPKSVIYPTAIASVICLIFALITILVEGF